MFKQAQNCWKKFWWGKGLYPHREDTVEDIYLRLYTAKKINEYADFRLQRSHELLSNLFFKKDQKTVIYIHGFEETAEQESIKVVVEAYLQAEPDTNIILVDWSNMAFGTYALNAAPNTKKAATALAIELKKLIDNGLNLDKLHLVGHSLGGQIVGYIGRELQKVNIKLKRITALDPAFPMFYYPSVLEHISESDADCVDVIHTDAGFYGAPVVTGSIDFWPNGGVGKQPGCPKFAPVPLSDESLCSHWRSWWFWAESITNPTAFPSVLAKSYRDFKNQYTSADHKQNVVYMGGSMDTFAKGSYYLTTNCKSPFGKGTAGTYIEKK